MEFYIFIGVVVFFGLYLVALYNGLVTKKNRVENSFSQIDVQLKRRHDLIPNLIEVAKKYMKHESDTLTAITKARNTASAAQKKVKRSPGDAGLMKGLMEAEGVLGKAMSGFQITMEAYPDLKANQNMMQLNEELSTTENKISFSRQHYNDEVMTYNTAIESFPAVLFASMFKFMEKDMFEIEDATEREAIKVSF